MRAGILALQGDFLAHGEVLRRLGANPVKVRSVRELAGLDVLVIPGGESTALLHLMEGEPWFEAIREFWEKGGAVLGTCAGAILLAREVSPIQPSLGLLDVSIERNAYGRQVDSFEVPLEPSGQTGVFIRAPRIRRLGADVEVLARSGDVPVLVVEGRVMAATFHPELTSDASVHARLLSLPKRAA